MYRERIIEELKDRVERIQMDLDWAQEEIIEILKKKYEYENMNAERKTQIQVIKKIINELEKDHDVGN